MDNGKIKKLPISSNWLIIEWNRGIFGTLGGGGGRVPSNIYMGYLLPFSVCGHFGVIDQSSKCNWVFVIFSYARFLLTEARLCISTCTWSVIGHSPFIGSFPVLDYIQAQNLTLLGCFPSCLLQDSQPNTVWVAASVVKEVGHSFVVMACILPIFSSNMASFWDCYFWCLVTQQLFVIETYFWENVFHWKWLAVPKYWFF